jgi:hypothetical protein
MSDSPASELFFSLSPSTPGFLAMGFLGHPLKEFRIQLRQGFDLRCHWAKRSGSPSSV